MTFVSIRAINKEEIKYTTISNFKEEDMKINGRGELVTRRMEEQDQRLRGEQQQPESETQFSVNDFSFETRISASNDPNVPSPANPGCGSYAPAVSEPACHICK